MNIVQRHLSGGFHDRYIQTRGIVIHYISAGDTQPDARYDPDAIIDVLESYGFAYHDLICRDGTVIELVPAPMRAWHAGESEWHGRPDCNSWMLGIALAGMHHDPFTDVQYDALAQRIGEYVTRYSSIRPGNIVGHEDVAPQRKIDPGPEFDWDRLRAAIGSFWSPA